MVAYRRLTPEKVEILRALSRFGHSNRAIAADLGCTENAVRYWCAKTARKQPQKPPKRKPSARKAVNARRSIIEKLAGIKVTVKHRTRRQHSGSGSIQVALRKEHGIEVSKSTIRRDLIALGWKRYARRRATVLDEKDLKKRVEFARHNRKNDPRRYMFTDEKTFTCGDCTSAVEWAPSKADVTHADRSTCFQDTVYVWGAIGWNFRHLVIIRKTKQSEHRKRKKAGEERKSSEAFTSRTYIRRCLAGRVQRQLDHGRIGSRRLILQADNHRSHYSKEATEYMDRKNVMWTSDWPARSPDLNPIENVWAEMSRKVSEEVPLTADELEKAILKVWAAFTDDQINRYVKSFKGKCDDVVAGKGKPAGSGAFK